MKYKLKVSIEDLNMYQEEDVMNIAKEKVPYLFDEQTKFNQEVFITISYEEKTRHDEC